MAGPEIFILILGDSPASDNMFPVRAPGGMSVGEWRKEVYNERKNNRFKGYDAADLTLWKVCPLPFLRRPMC
jgi:hypothetical protein